MICLDIFDKSNVTLAGLLCTFLFKFVVLERLMNHHLGPNA